MRKLLFFVLLFCSLNIFAKGGISTTSGTEITPFQINQMFDEKNTLQKISKYQDLVEKEEKINECISTYVEKQSKSYAKIPQNDLYDLFHNFSKIISRVYGQKQDSNQEDVPYEEKLEALATIQCEAYYAIGVLK